MLLFPYYIIFHIYFNQALISAILQTRVLMEELVTMRWTPTFATALLDTQETIVQVCKKSRHPFSQFAPSGTQVHNWKRKNI